MIVEARALARCCGESALCMVGAKFDPDHWKALIDDEIKSRKGRARLLLGNTHWLTADQAEKLESQVAAMTADWKRVSGLDYAKIAQKGGCEIHYVIYRQLSADAAHASFESLFHVTESHGTIESLQPAPKLSPEMICERFSALRKEFVLVAARAEFLHHRLVGKMLSSNGTAQKQEIAGNIISDSRIVRRGFAVAGKSGEGR